MAKQHKLAWNGVDIDTALEVPQLSYLANIAAEDSSGDVWRGAGRTELVSSTADCLVFKIKNHLTRGQLMMFTMLMREHDGRVFAETTIHEYRTLQETIFIFIPIGPRKLVVHNVYMEFARNLAEAVRQADPTAVIRFREGVQPLQSPNSGQLAPMQQAAPVPQAQVQAPVATAAALAVEPQPAARDAAWAALFNPVTTAQQLAEVAGNYPEFAAQIAQHPNCYPELQQWAASQA